MRDDPYEALAEPFVNHYETIRGAVRHALVDRQLREHIRTPPGRILDVGGGAGHQSIPLARDGFGITILDPSQDMLAHAEEALRIENAETRARVELVDGFGEDAASLFTDDQFDAVLCHGVLPYVEDVRPLLTAMGAVTAGGGVVSLLVKNAAALALRPALLERFGDAIAAFDADRDIGGLGVVTRAHTLEDMRTRLADMSFDVIAWYGVRVFTDHLLDQQPGSDLELVLEAEWQASHRDPYRALGRLLHIVGRKQ